MTPSMDVDHESCDTYVDAEHPLIKRAELIRLLCQSLRELGYPQISEELTRLSSYTCEARSITNLRTNVLEGNWLAAVSSLEESSLDCQLSSDQINRIKFILLRQYALEVCGCTAHGFYLLSCTLATDTRACCRRSPHMEITWLP